MALPDHPDALRALARDLDRRGRPDEAAVVYERLLALQPGWANGWFNLGQARWRSRRFEAALQAYERALAAGLAGPEEAHLNRAVILAAHLSRPDEARQALELALALNPRYKPALLNLGNLCEQAGDREGATAHYTRLLELEPGHALALSRLPNLRRLQDPQDPLLARLSAALAEPRRSPAERADLGFALGKALDDVDRCDEAFAAYVAANAASRSAAPGRRYDKAAAERYVGRLMTTFDRAPRASEGPASGAPIFICGPFRSGSTLFERLLGAHPGITAGGELDLMPALAARHLPEDGDWAVLRDPGALHTLGRGYLQAVAQRFPGAGRLTDKRPDNLLHVGLIKSLFPDARIVITRRQPLDNGLALFFLHLGPGMPYAHDLEDIGHWLRLQARLADHWQRLYGDDVYVADYDRLVADPQPQVRRLLAFCGLDWDPACLDFHAAPGHVATASLWQVRQPLYQHASGRWRRYERHLAPLSEALQPVT